jgi:hypothetical protein
MKPLFSGRGLPRTLSFCMALFFCLTSFTSVGFAQTRDLLAGWNLVSLPVSASVDIRDHLDANLTGGSAAITKIWNFDGKWKKWEPGSDNSDPGTQISEFQQNRGYWFLLDLPQTLTLADSATTKALQLDRTGWALVSFNQTQSLTLATDVLSASNFDINHDPENIAKVWEFSKKWKSYSSQTPSPDLTTIKPGYAYWFLVADSQAYTVPPSMTITPTITVIEPSDPTPILVIGGATTLLPPDNNEAAALLGRPRSFSKYSTSRHRSVFASTASASETSSTSETNSSVDNLACSNASDEGTVIGYAKAFSLEGELLNAAIPAEIRCSNDPTKPLTYEISFSKSEAEKLQQNPNLYQNLVISVELNSGQEQKSLLSENITKGLPLDLNQIDPEAPPLKSEGHDTDSTSTLGIAVLETEIARRLGVSPDRLRLGETHSGLEDQTSEISTLTRTENLDFDLKVFSASVMRSATDPTSIYSQLKQSIENVNNPQTLGETGRATSRSDEINAILLGQSKDSQNDASYKENMLWLQQVSSQISDLQSRRSAALAKAVLSEEDSSNQNLDAMLNSMLQSKSGDENLMDIAAVLTNSLGMAESTSGDALLQDLTKSRFQTLISSVNNSLSSLNTSDGTTRAMELIASALEYPDDLVALLAKNTKAAKDMASIVGRATVLLERGESEDASQTTTEGRKLEDHADLVSKLEGSRTFLTTLALNAEDSDAVSEILAGAVDASSQITGAAESVLEEISEARTRLETETEFEVNLAEVMEKNIGSTQNLATIARLLASNSDSASEAVAILAKIASAITTAALNEVLQDETLSQDFSLGKRILADAGRSRRIIYTPTTTPSQSIQSTTMGRAPARLVLGNTL